MAVKPRRWRSRKRNAFKHLETSASRKIMRIPWTKLMTNEHSYERADATSVLLKHIRTRKLRYRGHIMRQPWYNIIEDSLMTGLVEGKLGLRRPRISWIDNISIWTGLPGAELMSALRDRRSWATLVHLVWGCYRLKRGYVNCGLFQDGRFCHACYLHVAAYT